MRGAGIRVGWAPDVTLELDVEATLEMEVERRVGVGVAVVPSELRGAGILVGLMLDSRDNSPARCPSSLREAAHH